MTQQILQRETPSRTLAPVQRAGRRVETRSATSATSGTSGTRPGDARVVGHGWLARFARNLGPQDWYIGGYFVIMIVQVLLGTGPGREHSLQLLTTDVACLFAGLALTRGEILRPRSFASATVYRLTVWLTVFLSYFQLRHILPAVSERAVDAGIFAFDLRVFHVEPSLAWDKFVTPVTTEWFAFFYFGYFFLLSAHVLGIMLASKNRENLAHFAMGIFLVFCTGHFIYTLVPGYGPYRFLAGSFQHELTGGTFWHLVQATVSEAGAQKDIFPSLHTAAPTFFALYSFRHRDVAPYKYTWPVVAFCALQIIGATMFLRWHYLVDICAGVTLAVFANVVGELLVTKDRARRERLAGELGPDAVQRNFELLDYSWVKRLLGAARGPSSLSS
jgi:hypothetical protein